jgi:hypothetical protein
MAGFKIIDPDMDAVEKRLKDTNSESPKVINSGQKKVQKRRGVAQKGMDF